MNHPEILGRGKFAQGMLTYGDRLGTDSRIVIPLELGEGNAITFVVDTGSLWTIIGPEEAESIDANLLEPVGSTLVSIRGSTLRGNLYRVPVRLIAVAGTDMEFEATIWIPEIRENGEWHLPNLLGLNGFLNFLRFAVDPTINGFYFGSMEA
jgi:hypothetical protein